MSVVAVVQARMGSTRLPGKVLKDLSGMTVLGRVVERLRRVDRIDEVLVATTTEPGDDPIVAECRRHSIAVSRGDQNDVLERYYRAAQLVKAQIIVRITSDCPLIDPEVTDRTLAAFLDARPDYASNVLVRTFPRGLDTEVFTMDALARAWRQASKPFEREHVTPYVYGHPEEFNLLSVTGDADYSMHRWTLDTPEDLDFARTIYERFEGDGAFSWRDVLQLLDREPQLIELNRSVVQKSFHAE
jgi:spore coat polysaccharide biosynthesis protein SpsF